MRGCRSRSPCLLSLLGGLFAFISGAAALTAPLGGIPSGVTGGTAGTELTRDVSINLQALFILGDTQGMTDDATRADDLVKMADWVCTNKVAFGILGVISLGDLTQSAAIAEWDRYDTFLDVLDACSMPYFPLYGNHDGTPTVQDDTTAQNSTNFDNYIVDRILNKHWFIGSAPAGPTHAITELDGRTWHGKIGPFVVLAGEWMSIRVPDPGTNYGPVGAWWQQTLPRSGIQIMAEHNGVCQTGVCVPQYFESAEFETGLTGKGFTGETPCLTNACVKHSGTMFDLNPAVVIGGHWNAISCSTGYGQFGTKARTLDGSLYLTGTVDHSCATRSYGASPYSWNALLTLKRSEATLCLRTLRVINASTTPATLLGTPDYDRSGTGYNSNETCIPNPEH